MEVITAVDSTYSEWAVKDFEIKNLDKYRDLYVQGGTLLFEYVFKHFLICVLKYINLT